MVSMNEIHNVRTASAYSSDGGKVGRVGDVYVDDLTGEPAWVTISAGLFGTKTMFAPLAGATLQGDRLVLAYDRDTLNGAPTIADSGHISESEQQALIDFYTRHLPSAAPTEPVAPAVVDAATVPQPVSYGVVDPAPVEPVSPVYTSEPAGGTVPAYTAAAPEVPTAPAQPPVFASLASDLDAAASGLSGVAEAATPTLGSAGEAIGVVSTELPPLAPVVPAAVAASAAAAVPFGMAGVVAAPSHPQFETSVQETNVAPEEPTIDAPTVIDATTIPAEAVADIEPIKPTWSDGTGSTWNAPVVVDAVPDPVADVVEEPTTQPSAWDAPAPVEDADLDVAEVVAEPEPAPEPAYPEEVGAWDMPSAMVAADAPDVSVDQEPEPVVPAEAPHLPVSGANAGGSEAQHEHSGQFRMHPGHTRETIYRDASGNILYSIVHKFEEIFGG